MDTDEDKLRLTPRTRRVLRHILATYELAPDQATRDQLWCLAIISDAVRIFFERHADEGR